MDKLTMFDTAPAAGKVAAAPVEAVDRETVQRYLEVLDALKSLEAEKASIGEVIKRALAETCYAQSGRGKVVLSAALHGIMLTLQRKSKLTPEQAASVAGVLPPGALEDASTWEVNAAALASLPEDVLATLAQSGVLARKPAQTLTEAGWAAYFRDAAVRAACRDAGIAPVAALKADPKYVPVVVAGKVESLTMEGGAK
jgi:hypothetical protein